METIDKKTVDRIPHCEECNDPNYIPPSTEALEALRAGIESAKTEPVVFRQLEVSRRVPARTAVPLIKKIYQSPGGAAGCCLHIVLDDNNLKDEHIESCIEQDRGICDLCLECAQLLLMMSKTARKKAIDLAWAEMRKERGW